ncbi:MAG: twin-arginine translocase TatA/TatE family subunit [Solirubrobacteraceae bacterium]
MFRNPGVDLIVLLVIVLLILGPKRLPGIGKGLGHGMREFKEGITGESKDEEDKPALSEARAVPGSEPSPREPATHGSGEHASASGSGTAGSERSS